MFHLPLSTIAHLELHDLQEEFYSLTSSEDNDLWNMIWNSPHLELHHLQDKFWHPYTYFENMEDMLPPMTQFFA
jgi:succinate dehydrogenase flavin-adding protein (antitoxin of CptAB toxin-antitoxin module)